MWTGKDRLPNEVIAVVADVVASIGSHSKVDRLFHKSRFPGTAGGNLTEKSQTWIKNLHEDDARNPRAALGELLGNLMLRIGTGAKAWSRITDVLAKYGMHFDRESTISSDEVSPALRAVKPLAEAMDAENLARSIERIDGAVVSDPALAIGQAKELVETVCKTILHEPGDAVADKLEVPALMRRAMDALRLLPEGVPGTAKGAKTIKSILGSLATIAQGLAELRNLYGTGHGKHGRAKGLQARHARLAVGAAATLATFLFETHAGRRPGDATHARNV